MKLLVIGGGGREHALAWKLSLSPRVHKVFVAPGNAGTALEPGLENISITAIPELIEFATKESIAITIVGPEIPLAAGIVDAFRAAGLKIFGPTRQAAQLETSKIFAKEFMQRHHIPTAAYARFTNPELAHAYIEQHPIPLVIKADGLAAGKGVVVAQSREEAHSAVSALLVEKHLGSAGQEIIIEEFLQGIEVSFIVMTDGNHILPLVTSQDHKRLNDGDLGPNTGGMGAYSPAPFVSPSLHAQIMRNIIDPVINGLKQDGIRYTGFLYAGLMITAGDQAKVLEFNCRLGDPETQPIMLRLKSDLLPLIEHAVNGTLDQADIEWDRRTALGVVMAAQGYPENPRKNDAIYGLQDLITEQENAGNFHIFHAGTSMGGKNGNEIVTAGGRVLCVTVLGDSVKMAHQAAYKLVENIRFDGAQVRHDIGHQGINYQRGTSEKRS
ncbi:phosphoribosylamine--glycine ligase [Nitrosomonas oligotropha]|uniref:Phosphoribosylamine--glycine ligase n=1 Tax=Nitrosomonas oligotropha TaxID=42354 RepID=A0A1H8MGL3_9PROT|nr:phosphoribosylamine--glycine ligase [Nitrosomonas oligotropha]SDW46496.1 phosphoribosylamine--glycine ligase [Nitrosomonas oligotropha]SEO16467.1 phosphoribosylamine--glycine ligase [Nitrosomonas oligotropha]